MTTEHAATGPPSETGHSSELAFLRDVLHAEANALSAIASMLENEGPCGQRWAAAIDLLDKTSGHVVISGMGKSGLVGAKISATMSSLGQPSSVLHPSEAVHGDLGRVQRGDTVILLSKSGETQEVTSLAMILKADEVSTIGISGDEQSSLARLCTVHLGLGDITEACPLMLAPTTSTTATLAIGDALALAVARRRGFGASDFRRRHPGGNLGAGLRPITDVLRFTVEKNLTVASAAMSVRAALESTAGDRRPGAIMLVDENDCLCGIFTDADLRRLVRSQGEAGLDQPMSNVMTSHPYRLEATATVNEAVALVRERRLDEVPVVDGDGHPVGLVDVQDLMTMKVVREP